jgi:hypothetical protein
MCEMSLEINPVSNASILVEKWPHIARFLHVESTGWVNAEFHRWDSWTRVMVNPAEEAATYEEWAEFYEWRLESTGDSLQRRGLEQWTDDMAYCCRRAAAYARGEDPGEWLNSWQRRSDRACTGRAVAS